MVSRCDSDDKSTGPLEAEVIPVLHYVAEVNTSDESDGVARQEDEQIGIFQIVDKLEVAVDPLLDSSSSLSHPQLEGKTKQKPYGCSLCTKSFSFKRDLKIHMRVHPYSCFQCSKAFAHSSELQEHFRIHYAEKPYSCPQSSKLCTKSSGLQEH
jgi:hypothetical protein